VNGLRAAIKKGFLNWLSKETPDILLLQEVKAKPEQLDLEPIHNLGYHTYFHSAQKPGYAGVAIFTKILPDAIFAGCGLDQYDCEGRILRADFEKLTVVSVYIPSGTSGDGRQMFKMQFLQDFSNFATNLLSERKQSIISGDYNICHKAIDIHNPVANKNSSGFLPEERQWVTEFIDLGFIDSFRSFHSEPGKYSWWTYRSGARKKNLGWRIDYHMVSKSLEKVMKNANILSDVEHSDHCPVLLEIND
jgi:exodeoxyribonuclease-3